MKPLSIIVLASVLFTSSLTFAKKPPTPVFVAPVERLDFVDEVEALGTLQSNENVTIMTTVTELVTKINFEDGQRVKRGDVLVEMDAAEELAEKVEEQSRINEAQKQVDRLLSLVAQNVASKSALDQQKRDLQTAQARLNAVQSRINRHILLAPFDGVVGLRNISVGALAQPGNLITTLDDNSKMKLDFSVPDIFIATLKPGISVVARSSSYPTEIFEGKIASISSRVDPITRSITARAILDNSDQKLKAGMLLRVTIKKNPRQVIIIPEEALTSNGRNNFVMVIQNTDNKTTVRQQQVELGKRRKGGVEILSGLEEGQQIVTHGSLRLRPGAQVVIKGVETNNESLTELLQQGQNNKKAKAL